MKRQNLYLRKELDKKTSKTATRTFDKIDNTNQKHKQLKFSIQSLLKKNTSPNFQRII